MKAADTQAAMDVFAAALHEVLADGQAGHNQYNNSDTSEVMALTQVNIHHLIKKFVSGDNQKQATDIAVAMISVKVTIRERQMLPGAQDSLTLATRHGAHERQDKARDYFNQVESGTVRLQIELTGMAKVLKSGK